MAGIWREELPQSSGASLIDLLGLAREGTVKAMFVVGENPIGTLPPAAQAKQALGNLELLVCQELFLTETASMAHVVLPACSYAEKSGTFTNSEGHVQAVRQAVEPIGESRPDWEIESALSVLLGTPIEYGEAREILKEIRSVIPGYGLLGPIPIPPKVDEQVATRYLTETYGTDLADRYRLTPPAQRSEHVTLILKQSLFHSGKMSTRAKGLIQIQDKGTLGMNPEDASRYQVGDGDRVRVFNGHGGVTTTVKLRARVPVGTVWFPEHFADDFKPLVDFSIDPLTRVPYFRLAHVSIEKVG